MLEGLEISVLNLSDVKINNEKLLRLEAEYFKKEYLNLEKRFLKSPSIKSVKAKITCGPFGSNLLDTLYVDDGVLIVRPFNLKKLTIENDNLVYINENDININNLKIFSKGCLLFSRVGDIKTGVLNREKATISPNIIAVDFQDEAFSKFLAVFFETKYGFKQIQRQLKISAQPTVSTEIIGHLKFPKSSNKFIINISELVNNSFKLEEKSNTKYTQAEVVLLEEIALDVTTKPDIFQKSDSIEKQNVNIKSFNNSFRATGRLDAEYYQKKYEVVIEKIKTYKNGFEPLSVACNLKDKNFSPIENKEYKYIELSNIGKTGDVTGCSVELGKDLPSRARRLVNTNDVVISSIKGSLQSCGLIGKEYDNSLCSTGFYVINSEKINSETLIVLFKSSLMQSIMKQNCSGTILTGMNKDEFQNILVPLIEIDAQTKIAKLIEESFLLKKQSEHLLEVAKRAVELAIEENEEVAMQYIDNNLLY